MAVPPEMMGAGPAMGPMGGPEAGGLPPEIMAALMGGGGEAPLPEEPPAGPAGSLYGAAGGDNVEALRVALDALKQYAEEEDDEMNIQTVLKCLSTLQGILAEEQKMMDGAMSGKADPRSLRRLQAQQGPAPGPEQGPAY